MTQKQTNAECSSRSASVTPTGDVTLHKTDSNFTATVAESVLDRTTGAFDSGSSGGKDHAARGFLGKHSNSDSDSYSDIETERFDLGEDVYSLIFISPVCSFSFLFAAYMILLKLVLFTFLAIDLYEQSSGSFDGKSMLIRATQFFLLPVAIALQEDLIHVYTRIANIKYDPAIQRRSASATETKFALSFLLRFIDGLYSLIVNFVLMLITGQVLSIFLNFAALGFLQSIDDIAFHLAANGYLGDKMEELCLVVKTSSLPRRVGDRFTNSLDSVLFLTTFTVMLFVFVYVVINDEEDNAV